jgi:hypothetical protein
MTPAGWSPPQFLTLRSASISHNPHADEHDPSACGGQLLIVSPMFKQYPLVELVCENDLVYSEWLNRFDEILRELHGKDKVTVDLAFAIFRKIQEVYGFLEYEGEVDLT